MRDLCSQCRFLIAGVPTVCRQVTLFEEYMLLKEFEKRENIFANKVDTKLDEKEEMQEKVCGEAQPLVNLVVLLSSSLLTTVSCRLFAWQCRLL